MDRLCERPGCSENAAVAYGMRTEDLIFWLDALTDSNSSAGGVLCQRHGDSMVVPRGWTLDDLRDPDLHLFRPPSRPDRTVRSVRRRRRSAGDGAVEPHQLELDEVGDVADATSGAVATPDPVDEHAPDIVPVDHPAAEGWRPSFDDADDLGGLLSARSPLLSRAFRGSDRPD